MYCQKCGSLVDDGSIYCPYCGSKLTRDRTREVQQHNEDSKKRRMLDGRVNHSRKRMTKRKSVILVVLIILIIAVLGVFIKSSGGIAGKLSAKNYKICPDLDIVASTVTQGEAYVVVKNSGKTLIRDYTLAYVGYDALGNMIKLNYNTNYGICEFSTANIVPGSIYGLEEYFFTNSQEVKFVDAIVSKVTYEDGSVWTTSGLDVWSKDVSDDFSLELYNQKIENMKSDAVFAESNPYIKITRSYKDHNNQYSTDDDFTINVENIGERAVRNFSAIVMQYDRNGYAVENSFNFVMRNCTKATVNAANLEPGSDNEWRWTLFFPQECESYKAIVYDIEFADGTIWKNEYALQWMLYNADRRDKNDN